jgi:hypothetical protein
VQCCRITYTDESASDPPKEEATNYTKQDEKKAYFEQSYTTRSVRLEGIKLSTVEFLSKARTFAQPFSAESEQDETFSSVQEVEDNDEEPDEAEAEGSSDAYPEQDSSTEERNIITFGQFGGRVEILVRLKKTEELEGPKVSIEMNIPPLLLFLSPRQLHLLSELASGLICPDTEDHRYKRSTQRFGFV